VSIDVKEQYDKIYKYCYFKTNNATLAEDLTQETFLKYFSQNTYIERGKPLAYLYTIAKNLCIDSYKRRSLEELNEDLAAKNEIEKVELRISVKQALQLLPILEQELLLLRYINELSVGEICKITNLSRFSVYRKINVALAALKSVLREEDFLG